MKNTSFIYSFVKSRKCFRQRILHISSRRSTPQLFAREFEILNRVFVKYQNYFYFFHPVVFKRKRLYSVFTAKKYAICLAFQKRTLQFRSTSPLRLTRLPTRKYEKKLERRFFISSFFENGLYILFKCYRFFQL